MVKQRRWKSWLSPCAALVSAVGIAVIVGAGCTEKIQHGEPEDRIHLRLPATNPSLPKGGPNLFPIGLGSRWTYATTTMPVDGEGKPRPAMQEQVTAVRYQRVGGVTGIVMERQRGGVPTSREVYAKSSRGVSQLIQGQKADLVLDPPLPILRYPVMVRKVHQWNGMLRQNRSTLPATAAVRVTRFETVLTPAGKFDAFRVDTSLKTIQDNGGVTLPSTAWYAPNVGIVKLQYQEKGLQVVKTLVAYRLK